MPVKKNKAKITYWLWCTRSDNKGYYGIIWRGGIKCFMGAARRVCHKSLKKQGGK